MAVQLTFVAFTIFLSSALADLFIFSQCECLAQEFFIFSEPTVGNLVEGSFRSNSLEPCGEVDFLDFPIDQGLLPVRDVDISGVSLSAETINSVAWAISLKVDLQVGNGGEIFANTSLISLEDAVTNENVLEISVTQGGEVLVETVNGVLSADLLSEDAATVLSLAVLEENVTAICFSDAILLGCIDVGGFIPSFFVNDVNVKLLENTEESLVPLRLSALKFSELNATSITELEDELSLVDVEILSVPALPPLIEGISFSTREDTPVEVDLGLLLAFSNEELFFSLNDGFSGEADIRGIAEGVFTYTPAKDFFGSEGLSFDFGFDFCFREGIPVEIVVTPVADISVVSDIRVVKDSIEAFQVSVKVGERSESSELPFQGNVNFLSPEGFLSEVEGEGCSETESTVFSVDAEGFTSFCYTFPFEIANTEESFTVDFREGVGALGGKIEFAQRDNSAGQSSGANVGVFLLVGFILVIGVAVLGFFAYRMSGAADGAGGDGLIASVRLLGT